MKGSPFARPVEGQLLAWEGTLLRIQQTIEEWLVVQSQWLYLEPIFSSPNIIDQMPDEAKLFRDVDAIWRSVMETLNTNANVMQTAGTVGMLEQLNHSSKLLERINFGVNAYLDKKRLYFGDKGPPKSAAAFEEMFRRHCITRIRPAARYSCHDQSTR